jgi:putative protein-disulfide isomerase
MNRFIYSTFISIITLMNIPSNGQSDSLIYIGDPMCSWCYGFAPEVDRLLADHKDLKLILIMGGLRINGTEKMSDLNSFLKTHWEEVAHRSGRVFDYRILESDFNYDTARASRAVVTSAMIAPDKAWMYFKMFQDAFYAEGQNPLSEDTFADIAEKCGIERQKFLAVFRQKDTEDALLKQLNLTSKMGVSGFPTLLFQRSGKISMLSIGYSGYSMLKQKLDVLRNGN